MRKTVITMLLGVGLVSLAGCATIPYGNHAVISREQNQKIAESVITQLTKLYPPAQTRFNLRQPITDTYGVALVQAMRDKGYAVLEYSPQEQNSVAKREISGIDLRYIVDNVTSTNLYRVSIFMGARSISRAFTVTTDGKLYPIGSWVYKE